MNKICSKCKYFSTEIVAGYSGEFCFVSVWSGLTPEEIVRMWNDYPYNEDYVFPFGNQIVRRIFNTQAFQIETICYTRLDSIIPGECIFKMERELIE